MLGRQIADKLVVASRYWYVFSEKSRYILSSARARLVNKAGENIDAGIEPHIALEVKKATGKDDSGDDVAYSDFSAFYAPSIGDQIVSWYANK